jgi:hypothetical protein
LNARVAARGTRGSAAGFHGSWSLHRSRSLANLLCNQRANSRVKIGKHIEEHMQRTCPKEGCGAVYSLTPQHVGRTFQCKRCGSELLVETDSLRLVNETGGDEFPAAPTAQTNARSSPASSSATRTPGPLAEVMAKLPPDVFNYFFAAGALLVVLFVFLPLIDRAGVLRAETRIKVGDQEQVRLDRQLFKPDSPPTSDQRKQRAEDKKAWETKKEKLEDDLADAQSSLSFNQYWYIWGMLLGFVVLAIGSIGYLSEPARIKRVVGSIVICAMLLLVFITFVGRSSVANVMSGM